MTSQDANVLVPGTALPSDQAATKHAWLATVVAGLGMGFDAYVINLPVILIPVIAAFYHTSLAHIASVQSIFLFGYLIGTIGFALLADYVGRRAILGVSIIGYSLTTVLTALAPSVLLFAIGRFTTAVLGGAEQGVGAIYACEAWPDRWRGFGTGNMFSPYPLGVMLVIAAYVLVVPHFGWQGAFYLTIVIGALTVFLRWMILESGRFVYAKKELERQQIKRKFSVVELWKRRSLRRPLISALLINLGDNFNYHGLSVIALLWLKLTFHLPLGTYFALLFLLYGVQFIECVIGSYLLDVVGRRAVGIACALCIMIGVPLLSRQTSIVPAIIIAIFSWCVALGPAWSTKLTLMPEIFPTEVRGSGVALTLGLGRITAAIAPAFEAFLMLHLGPRGALLVFPVTAAMTLVGYLLAPEMARKPIADLLPAAN